MPWPCRLGIHRWTWQWIGGFGTLAPQLVCARCGRVA